MNLQSSKNSFQPAHCNLPTIFPHHSYFIEGESSQILPALFLQIEKVLGIKRENNPDYMLLEYENFSIDDARLLKEMHTGNVLGEKKDAKRIFIVTFSGATTEAQNSLLKMFEEPSDSAKFFVIAPSVQIILPTLRSRFEIIKIVAGKNQDDFIKVEDYLKMSLAEKIKFSKSISEKISKETLAKSDAVSFVKEISDILREKNIKKSDKQTLEQLKQVLLVSGFSSDRSASIKMLLDHLALTISI